MRGRARGRGGAHQYSRLRGTATGFPGGRADTGPAGGAGRHGRLRAGGGPRAHLVENAPEGRFVPSGGVLSTDPSRGRPRPCYEVCSSIQA
ncbi:hypothetical protein B005_3366 [Nocardiopsis alba ATCC BAA-2165]|uniref:Uncharacterized protein n=1 Tax=Nocardiopsis alba (strain ATCC BAA-2165 / BE74) TaxID=1205910 RepID=J7LIM9_NOCAA|nr:hypothetical protein B005_3366 [Nocardiopsis alba ATCC BAA-2165]